MDIERVEVLRGPQGTLAGRNSEGGAIKFFTRRPTGDTGGYVQATYGSRNRINVRAAAEFPLTDTLSGRITGAFADQEGYVDRVDFDCANPGPGTIQSGPSCVVDDLGDVGYRAVRGTLNFEPSERGQPAGLGRLHQGRAQPGGRDPARRQQPQRQRPHRRRPALRQPLRVRADLQLFAALQRRDAVLRGGLGPGRLARHRWRSARPLRGLGRFGEPLGRPQRHVQPGVDLGLPRVGYELHRRRRPFAGQRRLRAQRARPLVRQPGAAPQRRPRRHRRPDRGRLLLRRAHDLLDAAGHPLRRYPDAGRAARAVPAPVHRRRPGQHRLQGRVRDPDHQSDREPHLHPRRPLHRRAQGLHVLPLQPQRHDH